VSCVEGMWVPQTGIVDYKVVAQRIADKLRRLGGTIQFGEKVTGITKGNSLSIVSTQNNTYETKLVINCAGLYSDKVAQMSLNKQDKPIDVRIVPFRGEYFKLRPEKEYLVKNLIYPVPDPNFPFLGVHFTRMMKGGVEAGPNAVLAFRREGYKKMDINAKELWETLAWGGFQKVAAKYWETGLGEMYRSFSKTAFTKALQELIPAIEEADLVEGGAGVRAQACDRTGGLLDDFAILEDQKVINILNAPSPAATSSLSIGQTVAEMALKRY
jgi:(S)-2-hydroxyglutarate dehydrogenase